MATRGNVHAGRWTLPSTRAATVLMLVCASTVVLILGWPSRASAATPTVSLGAAAEFAVLAGTTITSTGLSVITGDIGVSPGTAVTGFPPGQLSGSIHANDAPAVAAQTDLAIAYNDAVGRTTTATVSGELGGTTKTTGVYASVSGTFGIAGDLTLDAQGDPNAVFIFKAVSTLITGASSNVNLVNGARSCNVFWQVGSSATLGANSVLRGNILAFTSITVGAALAVDGRTMAINGAVTMDTDTVTRSTCAKDLSITAPTSAALDSGRPGADSTGKLGPVRVTDARGLSDAAWIATVIATDFTDGQGTTISNINVSYWSGSATATFGAGTFTSGQPTASNAQTINVARAAYTLTGGSDVNSVTWNPTLVVHVPLATIAGTYTGTVTFSVA